jgi:hypothetical protein
MPYIRLGGVCGTVFRAGVAQFRLLALKRNIGTACQRCHREWQIHTQQEAPHPWNISNGSYSPPL